MSLILKVTTLSTAVRCEASSTGNGAPNRNPPAAAAAPLLSVPKPSWIVKSQSNVRAEKRKLPDPPCVVCRGSGRVDCHTCRGKGRTNHTQLAMLPKGEWPKWCRSCGGSGLGHCTRCLGTGEYRYMMGFQFMMRENNTDDAKDKETYKVLKSRASTSFTDQLLNDEQTDLGASKS